MRFCSTVHPERPEVACTLDPGNHPFHLATVYEQDDTGTYPRTLRWLNEDYVSGRQRAEQRKQVHAKITELAEEVRPLLPSRPPGTVIKRKTTKGRVAAFLLDHVGEWVPGRRFTDPADVNGGAEGLKRLREMRDDHHWLIEERPDPDPNTFIHQYRLVEPPSEAWLD